MRNTNEDIISPCLNFLLTETLNHLVSQIIYRLHVSGFQGQLAHFGPLKEKFNIYKSTFNECSMVILHSVYMLDMVTLSTCCQPTVPVAGLSIWISTTSPSIISVSSLFKNYTIRNHSLQSTGRHKPNVMFIYSLNPYSNGLPKSLAECFSLAHLEREDLTPSQSCEGCILSKRLSNTCIYKEKGHIYEWKLYLE